MNLALQWCWKEWRAQRGLLAAYCLLAFACLYLGFLLAPEHIWERQGNGATVLALFVVAGVAGVLLFASPQLVRSEFAGKGDQFVRRLPGALRPAFAGKLLFVLLVAAALPLLGLCIGEVFLQATGRGWNDLFWSAPLGKGLYEIGIRWPTIGIWAAVAMLALPWVWLLATWLPGGRMAAGGTVVLFLLVGLGVTAVFRQSPGLGTTIASWHWLWPVLPLGLVLVALSWLRGRRGGGSLRSARIGLCSLGIALVPPAGWFGQQAWSLHHPDLMRLVDLNVLGVTPDGRYALASGSARREWPSVPLRIDLQAGVAEQIGSIHVVPSLECLGQRGGRYTTLWDSSLGAHGIFDLVTGERHLATADARGRALVLPHPLRDAVAAEARATSRLRAPGVRVWLWEGSVYFETPDGAVQREQLPDEYRNTLLVAAGHGLYSLSRPRRLFDLTRRRFVDVPGEAERWIGPAVGGRWLLKGKKRGSLWESFDPDTGSFTPMPRLQSCGLLGLFDDEWLLCHDAVTRGGGLFLLRPTDGAARSLALPADLEVFDWGAWGRAQGSLLERDPAGRIWLGNMPRRGGTLRLVAIDTATCSVARRIEFERPGCQRPTPPILCFPDAHTMLLSLDGSIVRVDVDTGARTQLFPRPEASR